MQTSDVERPARHCARPVAPELPTVSEAGLPGFEYKTWHGMLVPAGTPRPIVGKVNGDVVMLLTAGSARLAFFFSTASTM